MFRIYNIKKTNIIIRCNNLLHVCINTTVKRNFSLFNECFNTHLTFIRNITCLFQQNESRMITQYHYTAWPDHGTPDPLCLLSFHGHLKRTKSSRNLGPILVHCRYFHSTSLYVLLICFCFVHY